MAVTDMYPDLPDPETHPEHYDGVALKRGLAWLVDFVVIVGLTAIVVVFTALTGLLILPFLFFLVGFLYRWVMLANGSATLGMRLFSISFQTRFGDNFDSGTAFLHTAGYTASVAIFPLQLISIALMLISQRGQGLSDHVLGTVAINR